MKVGLVLVGMALAAMLAIGCGGTVVVTATPTATTIPTATPTVTPTATPTPTAIPTPDLRAACNKKMANVMRLWQVGMEARWGGVELFDSGSQISATGDYDEMVRQMLGHFRDLTDEEVAYFLRWGQSISDEDLQSGAIFKMFIRDLEDGEC